MPCACIRALNYNCDNSMLVTDECIQVLLCGAPVVREGLKTILKKQKRPPITIVAETDDLSELPKLVHHYGAHIAIVHLKTTEANMLEQCCTELQHGQCAVIVLSEQRNQLLVLKMLHLGIQGFIVTNSEATQICEAVNSVYKGEKYYCPAVAKKIYDAVVTPRFEDEEQFSKQERKIIELICLQFSTKEIAEKLELSTRTIDDYKRKIEAKTNSKNIAGIVLFAVKNKMIDLDE
jgi:DNA-binding NarL/FixJ family response regulator